MTPEPSMPVPNLGPYSFDIRGTDTDYHDRLHLFALFSYMQEAAYYNAQALGIGSDSLDGRGLCWLLIRISVRLDFLPRWGENITVKTWSRGTQKLIFLRDFEFFDQTGRQFGSASSEWLIARRDTHRPQRPDLILPAGYQPAHAKAVFDGPVPRPVPLDEPAASQSILTKYADFSDIDRNHHVNNTRYIAWCLDTVHALTCAKSQADVDTAAADSGATSANAADTNGGMPELRIRGLDIHYISEIRLGSKIHCYGQADDQADGPAYRLEARRADDDAAVFRARVLL